ncbi:MAG TPA: MlaD family protein [Ideonella sp.]|jgi:paraquat-inducible protein B|nr:MlaD family protein [Ideonella sp.]
MKRRGNATLIGAFVFVGLLLLLGGVIVAGGGKLFAHKERIVMHFSGSIYGLQIGAPVVFRGVRLGSVSSIGLRYDKASDDFLIPVRADLESSSLRGLADASGGDGSTALAALVQRGLTAQLSMQSLLTGQLYIDLDLRPQKQAVRSGTPGEALEIPTSATAIQNLKNQIDGLDFRRLLDDVSAIAASARTVLAGPQLKQAMDDVAAVTANLRKMSDRMDARFDPLADAANATLRDARSAANRLGTAADGVAATADRLGGTADRVSALVAPDSALVRKVQQAADDLAKMASALQQQTGEDSALMQDAGQALKDVSRAARALRELADLLERQPESLLRGRGTTRADSANAERGPKRLEETEP